MPITKGSERLSFEDWTVILDDPVRRPDFEDALEASLTPAITRYLPPSMQFPGDYADIQGWIANCRSEARALCIHERDTGRFAGLILLHDDPHADHPTIHIGYFLSEACWGKGYASEALQALVSGFKRPVRLLAGVETENAASARVLEKTGFTKLEAESSETRAFYELQTG